MAGRPRHSRACFGAVACAIALVAAGCREPELTLPPTKARSRDPGDSGKDAGPIALPADAPARPTFPRRDGSETARRDAAIRDESFTVAETLLASFPDDPSGWVLLGAVHERFGSSDSAERAWVHALELDPREAAAHRHLGDAAARRGDAAEAERQYRAALEIDPDAVSVVDRLVEILVARGDVTGAIDVLSAFVAGRPEVAEGWCLLGRVRLLAGKPEGARRAFQRAIDVDPTSRDAVNGIAEAIRAAGSGDPVDLDLTRRLRDRRESTLADRRLEESLGGDLARWAATVDYWAAVAHARLGDSSRAAMRWRGAIELDPDDADSREALALLLENEGRSRDAMRVRQAWCTHDPTSAAAWFGKGKLAMSLGLPDEAVEALRKTVLLAPERAEGHALLSAALAGSDPEGALDAARKAADLDPTAGHVRLLGDTLARGGEYDKAAAAYERALTIDPLDDRARERLSRLPNHSPAPGTGLAPNVRPAAGVAPVSSGAAD